MQKRDHILGAASNLLGIALVIIAALNVAGRTRSGWADDVGWGAALCFSLSCLLSYAAVRSRRGGDLLERFADGVFLCGLLLLVGAVAVLAYESA
jgi:hypothetical protein